jgi:VanZ family protein
MHVLIRKMAHVTEFGVFSITVFHGVRAGRSGCRLIWALATLFIAVSYAGLDEWHQSFVPLREARARDVAIDASGALLAQILVWLSATRMCKFVARSGAVTNTTEK